MRAIAIYACDLPGQKLRTIVTKYICANLGNRKVSNFLFRKKNLKIIEKKKKLETTCNWFSEKL